LGVGVIIRKIFKKKLYRGDEWHQVPQNSKIVTKYIEMYSCTVARGIALHGGFGEVPNVGSRKCKKPKIFMAFEGLRHHLNVLQAHMEAFSILFEALVCI
jgi:hypothetical protein